MMSYLKLIYYLLRPKTIFVKSVYGGLGDNLLISSILPALREKYQGFAIVIETRYPELFDNNPHVTWAADVHLKTTRRHITPRYNVEKATDASFIEQMVKAAGINSSASPRLYLTRSEIQSIKEGFPPRYISVCPVGKTKFSANRKEWGMDNFQKLREMLPEYEFVQIGLESDPLMDNVIDARGLGIRQSAATIHSSLFFLGLEGGFMHVARAVGIRSVIIFGGYIHPRISGYEENINIYSQVDCSPCYHSNAPHDTCDDMKCMKSITPEMVHEHITRMLGDDNED